MIGKNPKTAPSLATSRACPAGISKAMIASTVETASEMTPASQAFIFSPPSSRNRVNRGMAPTSALSASESATGSRVCWNMALPHVLRGDEVLDSKAADGHVEELDGVGEHHRVPRPPDGGGHLHQAARVGRDQEVGAGGDDVRRFAVAELAGRLRVEDVVDTGRATAELGLGDLAKLHPRDLAEQLPGLAA